MTEWEMKEIVGKIKNKINVYELNSPVKKHVQNKKNQLYAVYERNLNLQMEKLKFKGKYIYIR